MKSYKNIIFISGIKKRKSSSQRDKKKIEKL